MTSMSAQILWPMWGTAELKVKGLLQLLPVLGFEHLVLYSNPNH